MKGTLIWLCTTGVLCGIQAVAAASAPQRDEGPKGHSRILPAGQTVLRVACSEDGLKFHDTGEVFVPGAAAPDLIRLPSGDLLALFDYAAGRTRRGDTVMAVSRSSDEGESWSPLRRIRLLGPDARTVRGRFGDLVQTHPDHLRLFFSMRPKETTTQPQRAARRETVIRSAVTRDGVKYHLVPSPGVRLPGDSTLHPTVMSLAGGVHLYAASLAGGRSEEPQSPPEVTYHAVSRDGRRFVTLAPAKTPDVQFVGSILELKEGFRAYVTSRHGVLSLFSKDGRKWKIEDGVRMADAWDPAVTRLKDGSFLMLYCAALESESEMASGDTRDSSVASRGPSTEGTAGEDNYAPENPEDVGSESAGTAEFDYDQWAEEMGEPGLVPLPEEEELALLGEPLASEQIAEEGDSIEAKSENAAKVATDAVEATDADGERLTEPWREHAGTDFAAEGGEDVPDAVPMEFAPLPDFEKHVDYLAWFEEHMVRDVEDNAFDAYAEFMPHGWGKSGEELKWPESTTNMFSDNNYDGPPGPWHPGTHPEWEASNQAAQELLSKFREAALIEDYATRSMFSEDPAFATANGDPLLVGMLLPALAPQRHLVKATLADAWRLEGGEVSQERMLDAMETCLRAANHMGSGVTLIENLVGMAERALVQTNARWALAHNVFDERGMEEALDILAEYDRDDVDPIHYMRGEHVVEVQTTQYLFDGSDPDGPNLEAAAVVSQMVDGGEASEERLRQISAMTMDDARAAVNAFDHYCREVTEQMRAGYPDVRAADIDATAERYVHTNALTEILTPSLSRVHLLRARSEASRRATQLCYATHLFKAQYGRWPESLGELPEDYGQRMRTDPFTGRDFGYRLTNDEPRIYSLSENSIDDGGIHSPRWDDKITNDAGSDDYVFWPPQHGK